MNSGIVQAALFRRGCLLAGGLRQFRNGGTSRWLMTSSQLHQKEQGIQAEEFWEKNKRLARPLSPHLTIYKFQITSVLSITHRFTGLALSGMAYALAVGTLVSSHSFPVYIEMLKHSHLGPVAITGLKFLIAYPFMFHLSNGIRHLFWDMGKGFEIKQLYASGYSVVAASFILSLLAAMY